MRVLDPKSLLQTYYGYDQFRPGQQALIDGVLSGRDVFGIMPTGGGKSVCYQIPAMLLLGVTLVISPLVSLMQDQVLALKAMGIPAAYLNRSLTGGQIQAVYRNLRAGHYRLLYVTPERLDSDAFCSEMQHLTIPFVAVDEAHCISQWGQDFRPSYLRIVRFLEQRPVRPVVGAYTATATEQVRQDVERILGLHRPVRVVTGFDRPNLYFEVLHPEFKEKTLLSLLEVRRKQSGIVYCAPRKKVEEVCDLLRDHGFAATRYHAGLNEAERADNQAAFLHDRSTVMVATNAFGMGIDKSNVSFVIHFQMPKSIEAYYQEAGRAGRDGSPAECLLLFRPGDMETARFLIESGTPNEDLTPQQQALVRSQDLRRLAMMEGYCRTRQCLRGYLLEYFGQKHPETCGNCGSCRGTFENREITREAQMILSCVRRLYDRQGVWPTFPTVREVLRGSRARVVRHNGLDSLSTYGLMQGRDREELREMALWLESEGYLSTDPETRGVRLLAPAAEVLYRGKTVTMPVRRETAAAPAAPSLPENEADLYDALRELRAELARKAGVAPFVVFSNATLQDMVRRQPGTMAEFRRVSGVGELKASWYGAAFLAVIKRWKQAKKEEENT